MVPSLRCSFHANRLGRAGRSFYPTDIAPEEHKRRGDAADALFQEMKRRIAAALKEPDA